MNDIFRAKMFKFMMVIMVNNQPLTTHSKTFNDVQIAKYKQELGWKIDIEIQKKVNKQLGKPKLRTKDLYT